MIVRHISHYLVARPQHKSPTVRVIAPFTYGDTSYKPGQRFPLAKLKHDDELRGLWCSELVELDSERAA